MVVFGINLPFLLWPFWVLTIVQLVCGFSFSHSTFIVRRRTEPMAYWLCFAIWLGMCVGITLMFNR